MLPCIAAVAIATFVGAKSFQINAYENDNLLMQNVEALTQNTGDESYPEERAKCISEGGNWNMASVCKNSGFEDSTFKISDEVNIFGATLKGSFEKGKNIKFLGQDMNV